MTLWLLAAAGKGQLFLVQLLGFIVVVAFLRKFVWQHVKAFLQRRSDAIRDGFEQLERDAKEAQARSADVREQLDGIGRETEARLNRAMSEGDKAKQALIDEATRTAQSESERVAREIALEGDKAVVELRHHVVGRILTAAERAVQERMSPELNGRLIDRYLEQFQQVRR